MRPEHVERVVMLATDNLLDFVLQPGVNTRRRWFFLYAAPRLCRIGQVSLLRKEAETS